MVGPGRPARGDVPLWRDHCAGKSSVHLLLRRQLAPRRAGGRLLRHPAQRSARAADHLLDLGHRAKLHPNVTEADPKTVFNRFGGEGEGSHSHMLWDWKEREPLRFFVQKQRGTKPGTIDARYYIFDPGLKKWRHGATIESPEDGHPSVGTLSGGLNSFLENFTGNDREAPKVALYRLWLGSRPDRMQCLTRARGDGTCGVLNDAYFLAEGEKGQLAAVFSELEANYGKPAFGGKGKDLPPICDRRLPSRAIKELTELPRAAAVRP